jgi:hypothetical protein
MVCLIPCSEAGAILINLNDQERTEAIQQGGEQGSNIIKYINQHYKFGKGDLFQESGIVRTKRSKLMIISGLMAARSLIPTEQEQSMILSDTTLQIDIHVYGDRMDFANAYQVYLVQSEKQIEADKISADDVAYSPQGGGGTTGFPQYRATIRSYFEYNKIDPRAKTKVVLMKDNKKVIFEVNFADYK